MTIRPRNNRVLVFQVPFRQKTESGLYLARSSYKAYSRAEDLWIIAAADDCELGPWTKGMHVMASDAFELDPTDFEMWEQYCDDPLFRECRAFADGFEGEIQTKLIHEDSIIAIFDDILSEPQGEA